MLNKLILTAEKQNKFIKNTLSFIRPLVLLYVGQLIVTFSAADYSFNWVQFLPTQITIGAMLLYVCNVTYDYFKKLK